MTESIKKIVIFGKDSTVNTKFHNIIRKFLMIDGKRLNSNQNNYLETFFNIGERNYLLTSLSSALFLHRNDNYINKEEKILNQELLLSSDIIYFLVNIDDVDLDYFFSVQKYFNQNKKRYLIIFNSKHTSKDEFENNFLTSVTGQRIIKSSKERNFLSFIGNDYLPFLKQFIYNEFLFSNDLDRVDCPFNQEATPKLTIFGPPNSGKSTLLNSLLGKKRSIVSPLAGTTRESVSSLFRWKGIALVMKDTEGIVISKRNDRSVLDDCQISWIVLSSTEPVTKKILQIISLAERCNRAVVIIFNKVDIASVQQINERKEEINSRLKSFSFVPIVFISAQKRRNFSHLLTTLEHSINQSQLSFNKTLLTQQFSSLLEKNPPTAIHGKRLKIYYALHEKGFVHKFIVFVNNPELVHFSYHRYIVNYLRRNLGIDSLPIRLFFKKS